MDSIERLNKDVLGHLQTFLPAKDKCALAMTCKRLLYERNKPGKGLLIDDRIWPESKASKIWSWLEGKFSKIWPQPGNEGPKIWYPTTCKDHVALSIFNKLSYEGKEGSGIYAFLLRISKSGNFTGFHVGVGRLLMAYHERVLNEGELRFFLAHTINIKELGAGTYGNATKMINASLNLGIVLSHGRGKIICHKSGKVTVSSPTDFCELMSFRDFAGCRAREVEIHNYRRYDNYVNDHYFGAREPLMPKVKSLTLINATGDVLAEYFPKLVHLSIMELDSANFALRRLPKLESLEIRDTCPKLLMTLHNFMQPRIDPYPSGDLRLKNLCLDFTDVDVWGIYMLPNALYSNIIIVDFLRVEIPDGECGDAIMDILRGFIRVNEGPKK